MSAVAEIEAALERLPTPQLLKVANWLDEHLSVISASENIFQQLDHEEGDATGGQRLSD